MFDTSMFDTSARMKRGTPSDMTVWADLYWIDTAKDDAVRLSCADNSWYVTSGLHPVTKILSGPHTQEAIEMMVHMGAI